MEVAGRINESSHTKNCEHCEYSLIEYHDMMPNPGAVTLVCMDYAGNFTEVDYTWAEGKLVFNATNHGLNLIVE